MAAQRSADQYPTWARGLVEREGSRAGLGGGVSLGTNRTVGGSGMMRILVVIVVLAGCAAPAQVRVRWAGDGPRPPESVLESTWRQCGLEAEARASLMPASGNTVASVLLDAGQAQRAVDRMFDACMGAKGFQVVRG